MSILKETDANKWIHTFLVILVGVCGVVVYAFIEQMGAWFDLEAKIANFKVVAQFVAFLISLTTFVICIKNNKVMSYLNEVYAEILKVVWPDRDSTVKLTIGIVVALSIVAIFFGIIDFIFSKVLGFFY